MSPNARMARLASLEGMLNISSIVTMASQLSEAKNENVAPLLVDDGIS